MTHPFTDTYIAMAKAAEEIQALYLKTRWGITEYIWNEDEGAVETHQVRHGGKHFWLPRLDQLLDMLQSPNTFGQALYHPGDIGPRLNPPDLHELALSLVMKEKHGKRWDEKAWVK